MRFSMRYCCAVKGISNYRTPPTQFQAHKSSNYFSMPKIFYQKIMKKFVSIKKVFIFVS